MLLAARLPKFLAPLLDESELEGVLAHELSPVADRDILIGSIAAALAMGITTVARFDRIARLNQIGTDPGIGAEAGRYAR